MDPMTGADPLVDTIVRATDMPRAVQSHEPFTVPAPKKHALIVGGTHLISLSHLFPTYALEATILIPSTTSVLDRELEMERAAQFENNYPDVCRAVGFTRDLSGVDSDSVDYLIVCTPYPAIRDQMLKDAWRVVSELGKVVVFTASEIPPTYLANYGVANPIYYPVEGFYAGTMRKTLAIYTKN